MSKLKKMAGKARIAINRMEWKGFTLMPGAAYGVDEQGRLFASYGTASRRSGEAKPLKHHIIVYRAVNQDKAMPIIDRKTIWGANSRAIGRRPIIAEAGSYAAPWAYVWQWEQVHYNHPLAQEIFRAQEWYYEGLKRAARKAAIKSGQ